MADQQRQRQLQEDQQRATGGLKNLLPEKGPSKSQVLAVVTLLPVGGFLLLLAVLTLAGTLFGLAVTTPLFVVFSPVLVPAALVIGLAVTGFLTSGAFGITALSSLSWIVNYLRRVRGSVPEVMDQAKRRAQETAGQLSQRAKEAGQTIQSKTQEGEKGQEGGRTREGGKAQEGGRT